MERDRIKMNDRVRPRATCPTRKKQMMRRRCRVTSHGMSLPIFIAFYQPQRYISILNEGGFKKTHILS